MLNFACSIALRRLAKTANFVETSQEQINHFYEARLEARRCQWGFLKLGDLTVGETPDTSISGLVSPRAVLLFRAPRGQR